MPKCDFTSDRPLTLLTLYDTMDVLGDRRPIVSRCVKSVVASVVGLAPSRQGGGKQYPTYTIAWFS